MFFSLFFVPSVLSLSFRYAHSHTLNSNQSPHYLKKTALSTPELIAAGRSLLKETDASLARSARVVAETLAAGARAAEEVDSQTGQLERVLDDADALRETLGRARGLVVDVARGMATDKCLALLLLLVVAAAVAAVAAKVVSQKRSAKEAAAAAAVSSPAAAATVAVGRRLLGLG